MALPEITFNFDTGSDTLSSGSAPSTSITGTKARCRTTSPTRVGFWEGSPPSLGTVATDGSSALWFDTTSGRKWSKITAVKSTEQSTTGTIASGSPIITAIGSTTGMSNGDAIRVIDGVSPGTNLYSEILTVDSGTQVTLRDTCTNNGAGKGLVDPCQITPQDTYTAPASDRNWAIGGKLANPQNTTQLWPDLHAGWIVTFEAPASGTTYPTSAVINLTVAGDTTDGRIIIRGTPLGTTLPKIRAANTATDLFDIQQALYTIRGLNLDQADEAIKASSANSTDFVVDGCSFTETVGAITAGVSVTAACRGIVTGCFFDGPATGINVTAAAKVYATGNLFNNCTTAGIASNSNPVLVVTKNIVLGSTDAFILTTSSTPELMIVEDNSFVDCATSGVSTNNIARADGLVYRNNQIIDNGTGASFAANSDRVIAINDYNNYALNSTARSGISAGAHDTAVDPKFPNASATDIPGLGTLNFRVQASGATGTAFPQSFLGSSGTVSKPTIGAVQRGGFGSICDGNITGIILAASESTDDWLVSILWASGNQSGQVVNINVPKSGIPAASTYVEEKVRESIQAYLRTGSGTAMPSLEVYA